MSQQTTLLTAHKGVDLHAATALRVMRDRLEGGAALVALFRCELHTFWDGSAEGGAERLLTIGRYYNPNKHHYGVFGHEGPDGPWSASSGHRLEAAWPGRAIASDLEATDGLYDRLLGGAPSAGRVGVDVVSYPRGETGAVLSGVLWRLVLEADPAGAETIGESLSVARHRKSGLLLNPHMEDWRLIVRSSGSHGS